MKQFILTMAVTAALSGAAFSQGGPNATMGGASYNSAIAKPMSDNEALRRILYGVSTPAGTLPTGASTAANQTNVQANAGSDATKALGIQGITNGKPISSRSFGNDGTATPVEYRIASIDKDLNAVTVTTISTVWTPTSGKKFRLMGGSISTSAAMNVLFEDNTAGNFVFRTPKLAVDTPYNFVVRGGQGKLSATADQVLKATGSAAGTITGTIYGTEE